MATASAVTNWQARRGITDVRSLPSLYNRGFDEIRVKHEEMVLEAKRFFGERTTNLETFKEGAVSGVLDVPQRNNDTDRIPLLTPTEGFNKTITLYNRRSGIIVTEDSVKMQKHKMIAKTLKGLPESANALQELAMNQLFTNGFTSEVAGDGMYIFDTDHPHSDPEFGTWDNIPASGGAFGTATFFAGWLNLQRRTNEKDFPTPAKVGEVYYPVDLEEDVKKVLGSEKYPDNSLNAKLPDLYHKFEPVPGHWLTSTTAWFIHSKVDEVDRGMVMVWGQKPNYKPLKDGMNPDLIMGKRLKLRFGVGAVSGADWYANAGE